MKKKIKKIRRKILPIIFSIAVIAGIVIGTVFLSEIQLQTASIIKKLFPDTRIYETENVTVKYPMDWTMVMIGEKIPYSFRINDGEEYLFTILELDYMGSLDSFYKRTKKSLEDAKDANYQLEMKRDFAYMGHEAIEIPNIISDSYREMLRFVKVDSMVFQVLYVTKTEQPGNNEIIPKLMDVLENIEFK